MSKKRKHNPRSSHFSFFTPLSSFFLTSSKRTLFLFIIGFLLIFISLAYRVNKTLQLAFFTPSVSQLQTKPVITKKQSSPPVRISITDHSLDLPITQTNIINGRWEIAEDSASHLAISANPQENGPVILYAHNTKDKFGPIRKLKSKQTITITTKDNKYHRYTIKKTAVVDPKETNIFLSEKGEALFLYTCDGFADLKRFVVVATPVE